MRTRQKLLAAAIGGLVAGAVGTTTLAADKADAGNTVDNNRAAVTGECHGVNACKAQGECGGKGHGCAAQNACKGQGWVTMTHADCDAKGGTFKKGSG